MSPSEPSTTTRRGYARRIGAALGLLGLAGCSGDPDDATASTQGGSTARTPRSTGTVTTAPAGTGSTVSTAPGTTGTDTPIHAGYETTDVRVTTPDGTELGSVTAAIADTPELRFLGLSDTESLPEDRGMLFVYGSVADRTFVMREMDFGIDIVYADDRGVITRIHHAPEPGPTEDGSEQRYPGRGQYVLEVNYHWTTERGVEGGDLLEFDL